MEAERTRVMGGKALTRPPSVRDAGKGPRADQGEARSPQLLSIVSDPASPRSGAAVGKATASGRGSRLSDHVAQVSLPARRSTAIT